MNAPQKFPKELAARNLLLIDQPPIILGARLRKTTFTQFLKLASTQRLFACGDTARLSRKIVRYKSMNKEVTAHDLRTFIKSNYASPPRDFGYFRGIGYWQRVGKILWLAYGAYIDMRALADKTVDLARRGDENKARRKLAERDRLMKRHKREARQRRWGQRA